MNQIEDFSALLETMKLMYIAKNHDYGNSFEKSCDEYGITAALVRMEDKFNRLKSYEEFIYRLNAYKERYNELVSENNKTESL